MKQQSIYDTEISDITGYYCLYDLISLLRKFDMMEFPGSMLAINAYTDLQLHELEDDQRFKLERTFTALNKHAPTLV